MKETLQPIQRSEFLQLLEAKLNSARLDLECLEGIHEAITQAEEEGKIVHFYQDPVSHIIKYEVKLKPPIGFNGTRT